MSGPRISIVITPGTVAHRLGMTVASAIAAGEAAGAPFEVVVGLADADVPTREVAEALNHPRLRVSVGSVATPRAAAELAWGEIVVLAKGGDLLSPAYVARLVKRLDRSGGDAIARPATCLRYGGSPALRVQASLRGGAADRGRLMFGPPFEPPLAATRALLVRLPERAWNVDADWAWTRETLTEHIRHEVVEGAVYVAWSPSVAAPIALPPPSPRGAHSPQPSQAPSPIEPASEAEAATLLYARAVHARLGDLEASARANDRRTEQLAGEAAHLQAALAIALDEADHARRTADDLRASTSWKVTAPLRALVSLVKPGER